MSHLISISQQMISERCITCCPTNLVPIWHSTAAAQHNSRRTIIYIYLYYLKLIFNFWQIKKLHLTANGADIDSVAILHIGLHEYTDVLLSSARSLSPTFCECSEKENKWKNCKNKVNFSQKCWINKICMFLLKPTSDTWTQNCATLEMCNRRVCRLLNALFIITSARNSIWRQKGRNEVPK